MAYKSPSCNGRQSLAQPGTTTAVERRCILCGREDGQRLQYGNINSTERAFITQHSDLPIVETSWVCKKHVLEAKRHCNDSEFLPKWKRVSKNTQHSKLANKCGNPICTNSDRLIMPSFAPLSDLTRIFNIQTNDDMVNPFVLCQNVTAMKHPANHVVPFPRQASLLIDTVLMQTQCHRI